MDFMDTKLWKNSLDNSKYGYEDMRGDLIKAFLKARDNAEFLLKKIQIDFPNLTVHDITHVDGLWQVASVIIGDDYEVNPMEGFVLGCAFLMHDAVLSYDAVGGVNHLRELPEWKDNYEDYKNDNSFNDDEKLFEADFKTIRRLHAKYAENLYSQLFQRGDGSSFYVIEDKSLREHYGEVICKIAGSHHWNIDEVADMDTQLPVSLGYPQEWRVDSLRLACILRCADAGHIDYGRAPDYLLELLKINGVSKYHWEAQNRLTQIDTDKYDKDKVIIKSNISFKEDDFAAWNVAFDAVQVLNKELRASNELLKRKGITEFAAKEVSGAKSKEELCKYIKTTGWEPFDADVHISNVEGLIRNLGGEKLYGKENKIEIVLRELLQNARDAICARRSIDPDYREDSIHISIENRDGGTWISVKDNGVGMSIETVKRYFLNFGSSFWSSDLAKREFVGLNSSGFKSVGKFGIGFYSIFMVASMVIVDTHKYDSALDDNLELKFPTGLCLRPIVSHKRGKPGVSTDISFLIDKNKCKWENTFNIRPSVNVDNPFSVPYAAILANITAGLDVDVYYSELGNQEQLIHKNINSIEEASNDLKEWLKDITYARYRENTLYSDYLDLNYKRLKKIICNGVFCGFAALNTCWQSQSTFFDVYTVGGLANIRGGSDSGDFIGCIINEPITARREVNEEKIDRTDWAKEQYEILCKQGLSNNDRLLLPYVVGKYGIDMTDEMQLSVMVNGKIFIRYLKSLIMEIAQNHKKLVIALSSLIGKDRADNYLDAYRSAQIIDNDEVLFIPARNSGFLSVKEDDDAFPANVLWCITQVCIKLGLKVTKSHKEKGAYSHLGGECEVLVLMINQ